MDDPIFQSLTPVQLEAVRHVDGPMLILAGPGSGKTRVVTHRIAWMLKQGVPAKSIVALTFTNKAADEMRRRLAGLAPEAPVWMGTFHRFCATLLRRHARLVGLGENFSIYDADDSRKALRRAIDESGAAGAGYTAERLSRYISHAKNNLAGPEEYAPTIEDPASRAAGIVYPHYRRLLLEANAVDFDDLLFHVGRMLRENEELRARLDERYRYILVDEYQDTNFVQYLIVRSLSQRFPNLAVTGDPDQSIYRWRGAELKNILDFEHDYPKVKVVRLEQNYRSTKAILRAADALIGHNRRRKPKRLFTENGEGERVRLACCPTQTDEARWIAAQIAQAVNAGRARPADFAILYRINALSRTIEAALRDGGLPYQVVQGTAFYERAEVKDMLAWLHLIDNPRHEEALRRVINTPARGIGKATLTKLSSAAREKNRSLLEMCRDREFLDTLPAKASKALLGFADLVARLGSPPGQPIETLLARILDETGYQQMLADSPAEEDQSRLANVQELITDAREFTARQATEGAGATLETFLERTSLISDVDGWKSDTNVVSLMTLHAAKGLEFPHVFIVAVEGGILPHERSKDDEAELEEERRLLFVGMTRAKTSLALCFAERRAFRGVERTSIPSGFLSELPKSEIEMLGFDRAADRMAGRSLRSGSADEYAQEEASEDWSARAISVCAPRAEEPQQVASSLASLKTASQMLATGAGNAAPLGAFRKHGRVRHPMYGEGEIVEIVGVGVKRSAKVRFEGDALEHTFLLNYGALTPLET